MTTLVVFKKLRSEHLKEISRRKGYQTHDKKGSALAQAIADEVTMAGVGILLKVLTREQLIKLAENGVELDEKKTKTKPSIIKQILTKIQNRDGATKLFTGLDKEFSKQLKEKLDLTGKGSDASLFLEEAEAFGLENCFSTFDIDTLLGFAEGAGLKVDTRNLEAVLDCLIEMKDYKPEKKQKKEKKPEPEKSKKKPEIKKGITEIDLQSWYNLTDLIEYCQGEKIPHTGKKVIVIKRILKYLAGENVMPKPKAQKKRKAPPTPKSKRPTKKQKTGKEGEASEEAMDTDKPAPKKRGRPAGSGKPKETASATEGSEASPEKKGRGRPKKTDSPSKTAPPKKDDKKKTEEKPSPAKKDKGKKDKSSSSGSSE